MGGIALYRPLRGRGCNVVDAVDDDVTNGQLPNSLDFEKIFLKFDRNGAFSCVVAAVFEKILLKFDRNGAFSCAVVAVFGKSY